MGTPGLSFAVVCSLFICIVFVAAAAAGTGRSNETDQLSLVAFKASVVQDPLHVMSLWNSSLHFCLWPGVTCGSRHRRVTVLDLQSLKLEGTISPHIGNLSFLRVLQLQNNSFRGKIPLHLGRLRRLRVLRLHNNSISGHIPANLSSCHQLSVINLSKNILVGRIPPELGSLQRLLWIKIDSNKLTGPIPPSLGNLSSLEILFASKNKLVGSIPEAVCQLPSLKFIVVNENGLSGKLPSSLFNHSSIMAIDVGTNHIQGNLPSQFGNTLPKLEYLSIFNNQIGGLFPVSLSNATNLMFFGTGHNKLTGKVPTLEKLQKLERLSVAFNRLGGDLSFLSSLTNATNLDLLELNVNEFSGLLPQSISNLSTKLAELSLNYNQLYGSIPAGISNLVNLEALYLAGNRFTGNIPPEFGRLQKLQDLALPENNLSGSIPYSFGNLTLLTRFSLAENKLHRSIPISIGKCQNLILLDLSHNSLSGPIPKQVFDLSSLSIALDLSRNQLTGSIPMEIGNLINLDYLDLSENKLLGRIPATLGACVKLENLYLQKNFLQGTILSSFKSLRAIQVLDLSHNNLTGEVPRYLQDFDFLQKLNLSFNDLEGEVPTEGAFENATATSITGNKKLCGGIPEFLLPKCNPKQKNSTLTVKHVIAISCGLLGAILVIIICFIYLFWFKIKQRNKESPGSLSLEPCSLIRVSYQDLLKATDGFSSSNLVGSGSFGSVYRGTLNNGTVVAVKVFNLLHQGASKSFLAECEALKSIRHRNLVKILTACSGLDNQGKDFKALVYEFMVNGNLDQWLHPNPKEKQSSTVQVHVHVPALNLLQRLNIAIEVASAVDYLHRHSQTPVVHCDLKPSNVLLDSEMTAHVSDFGLAKLILEDGSSNKRSSTGILRGSVGYAAPEYGLGSEASRQGDVYSYGVLLLEMVTGKRPTDEMFSEGTLNNIHNFVKTSVSSERVQEIADPPVVVLQEPQMKKGVERDKMLEWLTSIFEVGIGCTEESARARPEMSYVVNELILIRDSIVATRRGTTYTRVI
ncbi:probable LRR receptor-like serine/threonine-protein kinase At3g47570 [Diospyros lotus]|uniref:probable LRR receptor-like serine/threonine-protein kinase At3g47570 n=1 Tax=Diospyros lotus TaxID=55363 RepID=UPI0022570463|nr:probable LRR receptor-like serine/threonine-protein kinase At3g47570 [Diospyros lotus]